MKRLGMVFVCLLAISILRPASALAGDENNSGYCQKAESIALGFVEPGGAGEGLLCVRNRGLKGTLRIEGLVPGNAYTVWWIYIDDPSSCVGNEFGDCGVADFYGVDPVIVLGRMDSGIAPRSGKMHFSDTIDGMQPSEGSQVWFLVFGHGAADMTDGRRLARQLLTPEDPSIGTPHLGVTPDGYPVANALFGGL